jgi:hypothetical protein
MLCSHILKQEQVIKAEYESLLGLFWSIIVKTPSDRQCYSFVVGDTQAALLRVTAADNSQCTLRCAFFIFSFLSTSCFFVLWHSNCCDCVILLLLCSHINSGFFPSRLVPGSRSSSSTLSDTYLSKQSLSFSFVLYRHPFSSSIVLHFR